MTAFTHGVHTMRMLILDELNKPDASMPHTHNPAVQAEHQCEYCWRCRLERVLDMHIINYNPLCVPPEQDFQSWWTKFSGGDPAFANRNTTPKYIAQKAWEAAQAREKVGGACSTK